MSVIKIKDDTNNFVDISTLEGAQGVPGPQGPTGQVVPVGGTANQVLAKNSSTDYDTSWKVVRTPCARFSQASTAQGSKDVAYGGVQSTMNSMDYSFGGLFSLGSDGNWY